MQWIEEQRQLRIQFQEEAANVKAQQEKVDQQLKQVDEELIQSKLNATAQRLQLLTTITNHHR